MKDVTQTKGSVVDTDRNLVKGSLDRELFKTFHDYYDLNTLAHKQKTDSNFEKVKTNLDLSDHRALWYFLQ